MMNVSFKCTGPCGRILDEASFEVLSNSKGHYRSGRCRQCRTQACVEDHRKNGRGRKSKYGLSPLDIELMLKSQQGKCGLCQDTLTDDFMVDHCPATGINRSLLCRKCNLGLGMFRDRSDLLLAAVSYLREHREKAERILAALRKAVPNECR